MPLNLAEQDMSADTGAGDATFFKAGKPHKSGTHETGIEGQQHGEGDGAVCLDATRRGTNLLGRDAPLRRRAASRGRIGGLLVERGARRTWRRAPSQRQAALDKKYAALLEDDDGRNFCTFNG